MDIHVTSLLASRWIMQRQSSKLWCIQPAQMAAIPPICRSFFFDKSLQSNSWLAQASQVVLGTGTLLVCQSCRFGFDLLRASLLLRMTMLMQQHPLSPTRWQQLLSCSSLVAAVAAQKCPAGSSSSAAAIR